MGVVVGSAIVFAFQYVSSFGFCLLRARKAGGTVGRGVSSSEEMRSRRDALQVCDYYFR